MSENADPIAWGEYYEERQTLPAIHAHLSSMEPFIERCVRHFPGKRVLEIGPGTGLTSVYFQQMGYEVTGLDLDERIVAQCDRLNALFGAECRFMHGDMFDMPFPADAFDACLHQGLMEHFDEADIVRALEMQLRVAKRVIFTVPTVRWRGGTRGDERMWKGKYWFQILRPFRVVEVFGGAYGSLPDRALNALDRRVLRGRLPWLTWPLALNRAGDLGFVLARADESKT